MGIRKAAARYLVSGENRDGTWGYNRFVAGDVDSTAQALMVLLSNNLKVKRTTLCWIATQQLPAGGFPTYPLTLISPANGWAQAHSEVTLNVLELFKRVGVFTRRRHRGLEWLGAMFRKEGLDSYWWPHPGYMLWTLEKTNSKFLREMEMEMESPARLLRRGRVETPESALILSAMAEKCLVLLPNLVQASTSLMDLQRLDGSWDCAPCLRVTQQSSLFPASARGTLYPGANRLFSTAHAVGALAAVQKVSQSLQTG
jgi:hypothetical protein